MPPEMPSIVDKVPVGAMVRSWELRRPYSLTSLAVASVVLALK